jgi:hypothetical protein
VGGGSKVSFWHDLWHGDGLLKVSYLDLISIAQREDVWVVDNFFFFFLIRVISLKNAKRNQVHMEYTREASKKEKKKEQENHES